MPISIQVTQDTWFIGHDPDFEIVHYSFVQTGTRLDSGQEIIELFYTQQDYLDRLTEIGIDISHMINNI
jgi:hypothetical protein